MEILCCFVVLGILMSVVPVSTVAETSSRSQSIKVIVTNQDNNAITYFHLDRTTLIPDKWCWGQNIFIREGESDFFPIMKWDENFFWRLAIPQDFNEYYQIIPKVWISVIDLEKGEVVRNTHLEPGESEKIISGLEPGRYLIRAGTTIQVDASDEWDTGIAVPPEGVTVSRLPLPPSEGKDESGSWECYHLAGLGDIEVIPEEPTPLERHYTYIFYKRYTYNTIASTITYVDAGEEDTAYVCLLTEPNALAQLAGSTTSEQVILEQQSVEEYTKNSAIDAMVGLGFEQVIKYGFPKATEMTAGVTATGISNLIYLGVDPSYDLE